MWSGPQPRRPAVTNPSDRAPRSSRRPTRSDWSRPRASRGPRNSRSTAIIPLPASGTGMTPIRSNASRIWPASMTSPISGRSFLRTCPTGPETTAKKRPPRSRSTATARRTSTGTEVRGATSGCHWNVGGTKGNQFVCCPVGILSGGLTLQARRDLSFIVYHPMTGAVVDTKVLTTGQSFTLPQGPRAYIIKSVEELSPPVIAEVTPDPDKTYAGHRIRQVIVAHSGLPLADMVAGARPARGHDRCQRPAQWVDAYGRGSGRSHLRGAGREHAGLGHRILGGAGRLPHGFRLGR